MNNGFTEDEITKYWTKILQLPKSSITKVVFDGDPRARSGKRKNVHPYGFCEVRICSTELVQRMFGAIQEFAGFENKEWLS